MKEPLVSRDRASVIQALDLFFNSVKDLEADPTGKITRYAADVMLRLREGRVRHDSEEVRKLMEAISEAEEALSKEVGALPESKPVFDYLYGAAHDRELGGMEKPPEGVKEQSLRSMLQQYVYHNAIDDPTYQRKPESCVLVGRQLHEEFVDGQDDPMTIRVRLDAFARTVVTTAPRTTLRNVGVALLASLAIPDEFLRIAFSIRWFRCGCPRVKVGHRWASVAMFSSFNKTVFAELVSPWPAFMLEIPDGLLQLTTEGVKQKILRVLCSVHERRWSLVVEMVGGAVWRSSAPAESLCEPWQLRKETIPEDYLTQVVELSTDEERAMCLIGRLVIAVCLASSNKDDLKPVRKGTSNKAKRQHPEGFGTIQDFVLSQPVELDHREHIEPFVAGKLGGTWTATTQWMVRAHWRRVAMGPGRVDRVWKPIAAYRKGDPSAPMVARDATVGTRE